MGKSSLNWRWTSALGRLGAAADHSGILLDLHYMIRLEVPGEGDVRQNPALSCQRKNPERCWAPSLGPSHTGVYRARLCLSALVRKNEIWAA